MNVDHESKPAARNGSCERTKRVSTLASLALIAQPSVAHGDQDASESDAPSLEPVDILLVDDQPRNLLALTSILDAPHYRCVQATSGATALQLILERSFALILLDVVMPDMDGFEVASLVKARPRSQNIPIIFLTAEGEDLTRLHQAYSLGAVDYLVKPVRPEVVRAKVGVFVDLFRTTEKVKRQAELLRAHDRRERERELAETRAAGERRYRDLTELIPQLVWRADLAGEITNVTRRWHDYTGLAPNDGLRDAWASVIHPEDLEPFKASWRAAVAAGVTAGSFQAECRLRRGSDGAYRWHLCLASLELDAASLGLGWMGTFTDIDERKRADEAHAQLLRAAELARGEAERALQARDQFLSIASHELRTPLSALSLQVQWLARNARGEVRQPLSENVIRRQLDLAEQQIGRLSALITALFDVSRIASGQTQLDVAEVDLCRIVGEVGARFASACEDEGCELQVMVDVPVLATCDAARVDQMLSNLMSNALRYGPGRPITLSVVRDGESAILSVEDRGIGIAPKHHARIFERFDRATSSISYGGLGLGLYVTRSLALAHGGTISVESAEGAGATFRVTLPLVGPRRPSPITDKLAQPQNS